MIRPARGYSETVAGSMDGSGVLSVPTLDCDGQVAASNLPNYASDIERLQAAEPEVINQPFLRSRRSEAAPGQKPALGKSSEHGQEDPVETLPGMLSRTEFLQALHREKRRTDRSKTPLSLMIFRLDRLPAGRRPTLIRFAKCLRAGKRETDYLGQLDDNVFAVLLPDTDEVATRHFGERILIRADNLAFSTVTASYPKDQLDEIASEANSISEFGTPDSGVLEGNAASAGFSQGYFLKRPIDVLGAAFALLLLSPVMLIAAAAVAATSRGPIIFKQVRLGKGGVPFVFYKFRSMTTDIGDEIHRNYVQDLIKGRIDAGQPPTAKRATYKMASDPRVTPVGRWIRKSSIDELPQLVNVLLGDMSLVGPRPPIPYEAENYQSWHRRRVLDMKPGITGLWQVEGRSRVSFDEMVRMDLRYIRNCSLTLDLSIMLRTVGAVLRGDGAT